MKNFNTNSGFAAYAMLLGLIALLSFAAFIFSKQASMDLKTTEREVQIQNIASQLQSIRGLVRQCSGKMISDNVLATSPAQPYPNYPPCDPKNNEGVTTGTCNISAGELVAGLPNLYCPATTTYIYSLQDSIFNPKPIPGFSAWSYKKVSGEGVYLQITATDDNSQFAYVRDEVNSKLLDNEIVPNQIGNVISVFIYRDPANFPHGGNVAGGSGGGGGN